MYSWDFPKLPLESFFLIVMPEMNKFPKQQIWPKNQDNLLVEVPFEIPEIEICEKKFFWQLRIRGKQCI